MNHIEEEFDGIHRNILFNYGIFPHSCPTSDDDEKSIVRQKRFMMKRETEKDITMKNR